MKLFNSSEVDIKTSSSQSEMYLSLHLHDNVNICCSAGFNVELDQHIIHQVPL